MSDDPEYIGADTAAEILNVSTRQALRYAAAPDPIVRSRREGRRIMLHAGDVRALAAERAIPEMPDRPGRMVHQSAATVRVDDLQNQLTASAHQIGTLEERVRQLQAQLDTRPLLEDHAALRAERDALATERDELARQLERARAPWWKKLMGS